MEAPLYTSAVSPSSDRISVEYLKIMQDYPVLEKEEEHRLALRFSQNNDLYAAQTLIYSNLRGVTYVARNYTGYGLPVMDLIQEGTIGLMKAVKAYNPLQGSRLFSWAIPWIKAEIQQYIVKNWKIVKSATTDARKKLFFNIRKLKNQALPLGENIRNIAQALNVPEKEVREMDSYMTNIDVIVEEAFNESDAETPLTVLEKKQSTDLAKKAIALLDRLPKRQSEIIYARFLQEPPKTLSSLAEEHGVSLERVRQLEKQGLTKLHSLLALS